MEAFVLLLMIAGPVLLAAIAISIVGVVIWLVVRKKKSKDWKNRV